MSNGVTQPALFDVLERKLNWVDARQRVLAQNIANADTPAYRARDLPPFAAALNDSLAPARTSPLHLAGYTQQAGTHAAAEGERAPDGNAVQLEDQLTKVADDEAAQAAAGNLWKSYMGMFMTALGHG